MNQKAEHNISCLLLCAGRSTRMGPQNKLLMRLGDKSVFAQTLSEVAAAGFKEIVIVTGHDRDEILDQLAEELPRISKRSRITTVHNADFASGMHSSIRAGVAALGQCDFFAVALADQPLLTSADYQILINAATANPEACLITPRYADTAVLGRANPTLIASRLKNEILAQPDSDRGCAYLFDRYPFSIVHVEMPRTAKSIDVDTREMFERAMEVSEKVTRRPDADSVS